MREKCRQETSGSRCSADTGSSSDVGRAWELPPPVEEEAEQEAGQEEGGADPVLQHGGCGLLLPPE
jgi:hypothetical protein